MTPRRATAPDLTKEVGGLAALFLTSGVTHLLRPQTFHALIPPVLKPYRRELILASGVAEIVCAAGLLVPRTRRAAGLASAALLVAVLPGNAQMTANAVKQVQRTSDPSTQAYLAASVARLPLQWPLIRTALRAAGRLR